jgi:hexosaminidase
MKQKHFFILCFTFSFAIAAAAQDRPPLIPLPADISWGEGNFTLDGKTILQMEGKDENWQLIGQYFRTMLRERGLSMERQTAMTPSGILEVVLDPGIVGTEAYTIQVNPQKVRIAASHPAGAFYGIQTFRQLLPHTFETSTALQPGIWKVPVVTIHDEPRFSYRGMHLDVGRHFFPVEFIKKYIDLLAMHKFNRFHWHLTEDQGWRIEIKKYPKLQEIAAWRKETLIGHYSNQPHQFDGKRYGGYYTQDEIREVVRYAAERQITIVPEIEMPGHALAALSAYPELACTPGPFEAATKWGVFDDVFCPKENTFEFLEGILTEVMDLFPGAYIHIGGDECPKTRWKSCDHCQALIKKEGLKDEHELQSYFIRRIERLLNSKGRQIIGWDEILEGGLAPNATVMSWRGISGGIAAAKQGNKVIMTPTTHCYLDYYQAEAPDEPTAIGGFLPIEKVYHYEPVPEELTPEQAKLVLGAQGNVWTEYMSTSQQVEYMAFPRALALAELTWTPREAKNFDDFSLRLARHFARLDVLGVNYSKAINAVKVKTLSSKPGMVTIALQTTHPNGVIRYTLDGTVPSGSSPIFQNTLSLKQMVWVKSAVFSGNKAVSPITEMKVIPHLAVGKKPSLNFQPHLSYNLGGPEALCNGVSGSDNRYGDSEWLGWSGKDVEVVIDLGAETPIKEVRTRFFHNPGPWIYHPRSVSLSVSKDGNNFMEFAGVSSFKIEGDAGARAVELALPKGTTARYLRLKVQRHGIIEAGEPGAGYEAWLFMDEISIF